MLTKEAFNALLKTLEEPPAHVIFILATTEAHKLPDTITSRTQRFSFKAIDDEKAIAHLQELAKHEKINIDESALRLLVEHGDGSFRDSIGLLDQVSNSKDRITRSDVERLIGVAPHTVIEAVLKATINGTSSDVAASLEDLTERGIAPQQVAKQLGTIVREHIVKGDASLVLTSLLESLLAVSAAHNPLATLELALFKTNAKHLSSAQDTVAEQIPSSSALGTDEHKPASEPIITTKTQTTEKPKTIQTTETLEAWWPQILSEVKKHNNTLYGVMRMAQPSLDGDTLSLGFAFGFHAKKIADAATKLKIESIIAALTGQPISLLVSHDKDARQPATPEPAGQPLQELSGALLATAENNEDLQVITSVFGGGEVLET